MEIIFLGIDDAGRGPVIGPMVIAGCLTDKKIEKEFKRIGVRDSKQITPKRREFLEKTIKEEAISFEVEILNPKEIDSNLEAGINLNELEAIMVSKIINKINAVREKEKIRVILDCPSVNRTQWSDSVKLKIENLSNLEIVCEHKADRDYISVAAASILAKQERERQIDLIRKKYDEDLGSGYPSDPKTVSFLGKNAKLLADKGIFRKSWKTWQKATADLGQMKLNN